MTLWTKIPITWMEQIRIKIYYFSIIKLKRFALSILKIRTEGAMSTVLVFHQSKTYNMFPWVAFSYQEFRSTCKVLFEILLSDIVKNI